MWTKQVGRALAVGLVVTFAGSVLTACGDDEPTAPGTGAISVTTNTTGDNPDPDGYSVTIDGTNVGSIGVNAQQTFSGYTPGTYLVELLDVAANCTVSGSNPRNLEVRAGITEPTTFSVDCPGAPSAVEISATAEADEVTVEWELSPLATSYRAELVGGSADLVQLLGADAIVAVFTAAADGLEDGVTYAATVYAVNDEGEAASNTADVTTDFFPWDENITTSLHYTGNGKPTFYSADPNQGFEIYTGVAYSVLNCANCHAPITGGDCTACHDEPDPQLGSQVDASLDGKCGNCHSRQKAERAQGYTDAHDAVSGGDCMFCHTLGDMHGDGTEYASQLDDGAIDAACENCHSEGETPGPIPANTYHAAMHVGASLGDLSDDQVDCSTCHIQSVVTCVNCHFDGEVLGDPPVKVAYKQMKDWTFMMNFRGKVHAANFQSLKWGGDYNPDETGRYTWATMAPFYAHTIARDAVSGCTDCHDSDAIADYNDDGALDIVRWNPTTELLEQTLQGRIPVPPDFLTSMRMDFVDQPTLNPVGGDPSLWELYQELGPDSIQIVYGSPLTADQMSKLGAN